MHHDKHKKKEQGQKQKNKDKSKSLNSYYAYDKEDRDNCIHHTNFSFLLNFDCLHQSKDQWSQFSYAALYNDIVNNWAQRVHATNTGGYDRKQSVSVSVPEEDWELKPAVANLTKSSHFCLFPFNFVSNQL